jgi:ribokinase
MRPKIVVVGSFNTDLIMYMPRLPEFGETVPGHRFSSGPGGKGSNQAVAAARLGADVTFIGCVGQDNFANVGFSLWEKEGIHTQYVLRDPHHTTGIASIMVDDEGENMIALALGANMHISPSHLDAAAAVIADADVLVTQLEINFDAVTRALQIAKTHGIKTVLNPAPARPMPKEILALADFVTPNEPELQELVGQHSGSIESDAEQLLVSDEQTIIVTMGAWGSLWARRDGHGHVTAYEVEVVDTVGGGDAFTGGLAVALAEGQSLRDAVNFANATAGLAVTKTGAAASMPHRAEVEALVAKRREEEDAE